MRLNEIWMILSILQFFVVIWIHYLTDLIINFQKQGICQNQNFITLQQPDYFMVLQHLHEAIDALKEGGFVWFNFYKPPREELSSLVDTIGIHPLSVEDCFDDKQVPKIEYFTNNTFILFNAFTYTEKELFIDEINLFIGKNFLITVSGHNSGERKPLNDIVNIIESDPKNAKAGPDFLMHIVLDYLVDEKYKAFDNMEDDLEEAEESTDK